ncbi:MAG: N-6 DNA methylase, partial [Nitrosospira sp.]|nr:N-6 DNA methylase [Nitrosospira sp.]
TKLVFYEALLKRFGGEMEKITIASHVTTGEDLRTHFEGYFAEAKKATGDYETVFGEDHTRIGNRIPFYADTAVPHWRELVEQIHLFDFSQLDYEVIGAIFERLISPAERHKYGQYYTRVEVVDLILSFCIQTGEETILDPACGGGTFLVRAYARKKECAPEQKHQGLLADLYGADIEGFATQLTTINLATRELINAENYPRIAHIDFFGVLSGKSFLSLPSQVKTKGLGESQHHDVSIPPLDAVVGNPPYVRQEDIPKTRARSKTGPEAGTKEYYRSLVKRESGANLGGRSDLHCYFWPHAWTFLKDEGYLCFLTSSQWLDVEYGFRLQAWILENFELIAVFESVDEPWFVGARVATTVTILRKQPDSEKRMNNTVRFVQLRRSIAEMLSHDGTTAGAVVAANRFRDEILGLTENTINRRYRARLVKQSVLWNDGVALGALMSKSGGGGAGDEEPIASATAYYGGKWGVHLRAPDLWFQLLDEFGDKLVPLGQLAEVRFGVKSGNDVFFFPKDRSEDCLKELADPHEFERIYKVPRKDVASGNVKLVACGTKRENGRTDLKPVESKYLEPEVHSLMEIDSF